MKISEGQGDDADAGRFHEGDGLARPFRGLHRQRAVVPAGDGMGKLVPEHRLGRGPEAFRVGEAALVDMQVEADAEFPCRRHEMIELLGQFGIRLGKTAHGGGLVPGGKLDDAFGPARKVFLEVAK